MDFGRMQDRNGGLESILIGVLGKGGEEEKEFCLNNR
jgi:hypothetical protein